MKLRERLAGDARVAYVLERYEMQTKVPVQDVITAYNLLCRLHPQDDGVFERSIEAAYVASRYMEAEVDDVLSVLLFRDYAAGRIDMPTFAYEWGEARGMWYHDRMKEACQNARRREGVADDICVETYITVRVCDKMLSAFMRRVRKDKVPDAYLIPQAYALLREAQYWNRRKTGAPSISHGLYVAATVADLFSEGTVIAAALLHDVMEKTGYTVEDVTQHCGQSVVEYVYAVTDAVREANEVRGRDIQGLDTAESVPDKINNGLRVRKKIIRALGIKASEILHNLQTMESLSESEKHTQSDEVEAEYLPLLREFGLHELTRKIEDLLWRASDTGRYTEVARGYARLLRGAAAAQENMVRLLRAKDVPDTTARPADVRPCPYTVFEVYEALKDKGERIEDLLQNMTKHSLPICDIEVQFPWKGERADLFAPFYKKLLRRLHSGGAVVTDVGQDPFFRYIMTVEDGQCNRYRLLLGTPQNHTESRVGCYMCCDVAEEEKELAPSREHISIQLRNGQMIELPRGASVLDAAFAIHEDIGIAAKSAKINGAEVSLFSILRDGDRLDIETDIRPEQGENKIYAHVRICWLDAVVTRRARKKIMRYLEKQYEGDNPRSENEAPDQQVEAVAEGIWQVMRSVTPDMAKQ